MEEIPGQERKRTVNMKNAVLTTKQLGKSERKLLKEFKLNLGKQLPPGLKEKYKKLKIKDKLFCLYYFDTATQGEAAIRAGYSEATASTRGSEAKRRCRGIINWVEEHFLEEVGTRIATKNIISREVIIDKLARMFLPNLADFEDLKVAKRKGLFDAVHELEYDSVYNDKTQKLEKTVKKIKLHDPVKTAALICKMMGYETAQKREVTYPEGGPNGEQPTTTLQINMVEAAGKR